jgi:hypothetical protein
VCDYVTEHDVDILFLQETWLDHHDTATIGELKPPGFSFLNFPRETGQGGGGIGVLFKTTLKLTVTQTDCKSKFFEHACITDSNTGLRFICVYRPKPSVVNKYRVSDFLQEFDTFIDEISLMPNKLIILGDFNIHVNKPEKSDSSQFLNSILINGFHQHISEPTHIHGNTLDLLISRPEDNIVVNHKVKVSLISDHYYIECTLRYMKPPTKKVTRTKRDFSKFDTNTFCVDLEQCLSNMSDTVPSADYVVDQFATVCTTVLDNHAPLVTRSVSLRSRLPWFTEEIKHARQVRRRLERKWRKSKAVHDRDRYLDQLHLVNDMITHAKTEFFKAKVADADSKDLFRTVNSLLNRSNKPLPTCDSIDVLCNKFGTFFKSKIDKIRKELDDTCIETISDMHTERAEEGSSTRFRFDHFDPASQEEVEQVMRKLPNKTCMLDPLPTWLLKQNLSLVSPIITRIVNVSLNKTLKNAIITPILKSRLLT